MSPDPGEPGHEQRGWTHRICRTCWERRCERRGEVGREPVTVTDDGAAPCCYCGAPTADGIYTRDDATAVHRRTIDATLAEMQQGIHIGTLGPGEAVRVRIHIPIEPPES